MAYTWQGLSKGYEKLWGEASITPAYHAAATREAKAILAAKPVLIGVQTHIRYPWYFLGCLQAREAGFNRDGSLNTNAFLGNGQRLDRVTTEVPAGMGPWKDWASGAIDAITHELTVNPHLSIPPEGISAPYLCFFAEAFNGEGYFSHNINSPYVWSFTNLYTRGKFSSDHGFDPELVDPQCGVAAYLLALCELDATIAAELKPTPAPTPIPVTVPQPTTSETITMDLTALTSIFAVLGKVGPILSQLLPVIINAVQTIEKATGGNTAQATSAVIQHLTPGQPNSPALNG